MNPNDDFAKDVHAALLDLYNDYDWNEVLAIAGFWSGYNDTTFYCGYACVVPCDAFDKKEPIEIIAGSEGENDGPNWLIVLKQGARFVFIEAGCDYTGWDCQSGGSAFVADSLDRLIAFGLSDENAERLGLGKAPERDGTK